VKGPWTSGRTAAIVLVAACITCLAGCQPRAPQTMMQAQGGILMTQPLLKFDGKVEGTQYEPFEVSPFSTRIGANVVIATARMSGSEFSVVAPKTGPALNGITLVHEALRGLDIKTPNGRTAFRKRLQELFTLHKAMTKGLVVTEDSVVILTF